jgi:hypothetical protein
MIRFSDDGESHGITAEFLQSHPALLVREEMAEASGSRTLALIENKGNPFGINPASLSKP